MPDIVVHSPKLLRIFNIVVRLNALGNLSIGQYQANAWIM